MKPEPKIVQHNSAEEIDGACAYYDSGTHEIHILKPDALYDRILEHERNHANRTGPIRLLSILSESYTLQSSLGIMFLSFILGFILISLRSSIGQLGLNYSIIAIGGIIFGSTFTLIIRLVSVPLEEFFAERYAIAKSKQPQANNP